MADRDGNMTGCAMKKSKAELLSSVSEKKPIFLVVYFGFYFFDAYICPIII